MVYPLVFFVLKKEDFISIRIRRGQAKTKPKPPKERINRQIQAKKVRLISQEGKQIGIVPLSKALHAAGEARLDLVEVSPNANPPVCKILDFGAYYYKKERKMREARKKQHIVQTKEIKFTPTTEEHDLNFKLNHAIKFLKQHNKVKFTVRFRGRQLAHKDLGYNLLNTVLDYLDEIIEIDSKPKSEGRTISTIVSPTKDIDNIIEDFNKKKEDEKILEE